MGRAVGARPIFSAAPFIGRIGRRGFQLLEASGDVAWLPSPRFGPSSKTCSPIVHVPMFVVRPESPPYHRLCLVFIESRGVSLKWQIVLKVDCFSNATDKNMKNTPEKPASGNQLNHPVSK